VSEESRSNDGLLSLLAGIGVGAVLGAAVALLYAPQSGEVTRTQIRETAEDTLNNVRSSLEELRAKVEEVRSAVRRRDQEGAAGPEAEPSQGMG
jgi:gas vesicle protein